MKNLKCYIDVNFTIEKDFERYSDKDKADFIKNKELMTDLFKEDLLKKLDYFSQNIKDLNTVITFEGDDIK